MKKKMISIVFLLITLCGTCMAAFAAEDNDQFLSTASQLKSKGSIVYQNGTDSVVIDSNDLYVLAEAFDSFKAAVYSQMEEMNTYLTMEEEGVNLTTNNDLHIVHLAPSDVIDPVSVDFDTLVEGLASSQSIPHTPSEYGYDEDINLYKTADGLLTTESSDGAEMIEIDGAIADNLSAGTSAWVDGELILGTGVDNKKFYNQGYTDGFNKVMSSVDVSYIYHTHTKADGTEAAGTIYSTSNPGGCYIASGHTHNSSCPRYHNHDLDPKKLSFCCQYEHHYSEEHGSYYVHPDNCPCDTSSGQYRNDTGKHYGWIPVCNNEINAYSCKGAVNTWVIGCGKTNKTIESATIVFK